MEKDSLTDVVLESTLEVGGKAPKENNRNLSTATKHLIRKRSRMVIKTIREKIGAVEMSKTTN